MVNERSIGCGAELHKHESYVAAILRYLEVRIVELFIEVLNKMLLFLLKICKYGAAKIIMQQM